MADCDLVTDAERETVPESDGNREADAVTLKPRVGDRDGDAARDGDALADRDGDARVAVADTERERETVVDKDVVAVGVVVGVADAQGAVDSDSW